MIGVEFGLDTFGDVTAAADGRRLPYAQVIRNVVEQAVLMATSPIVSPQVVRQALGADSVEIQPFSHARRDFERDYFVRVLKATGGNVSRAAVLADRNRTEFYKLLQRHKLTPADFRTTGG